MDWLKSKEKNYNESMKWRTEAIEWCNSHDINEKSENGLTQLQVLLSKSANQNRRPSAIVDIYMDNGADDTVRDADGNTPLMLAAKNGHVAAVCLLKENKEMLNAQNNAGRTALHLASFSPLLKNAQKISYMLVEAGADPDIKDNKGRSARDYLLDDSYETKFAFSRERGRYLIEIEPENWNEVCRYVDFCKRDLFVGKRTLPELVEFYNNIADHCTRVKYDYDTPFCEEMDRKILDAIDKEDEDDLLFIKDVSKAYLPMEAKAFGKLLKERGFDFNTRLFFENNPTTIAGLFIKDVWYNPEALEVLVEEDIDINAEQEDGYTLAYKILQAACERIRWFNAKQKEEVTKGIIKVLDYFDNEAIESVSKSGMSAVHFALRNLNSSVFKYMLARGVDVNVVEIYTDSKGVEHEGASMLEIASNREMFDIIKLLLKAGANTDNWSIEYFANMKPTNEVLELLDMYDSIDDVCDNCGRTLLMKVIDQTTDMHWIEYLLKRGANVKAADNHGNTPLHYAVLEEAALEVFDALIYAGAYMDISNMAGDTPLSLSIYQGYPNIALYLLNKGADYNTVNEDNKTPMDLAIERGYNHLIELMPDVTVAKGDWKSVEEKMKPLSWREQAKIEKEKAKWRLRDTIDAWKKRCEEENAKRTPLSGEPEFGEVIYNYLTPEAYIDANKENKGRVEEMCNVINEIAKCPDFYLTTGCLLGKFEKRVPVRNMEEDIIKAKIERAAGKLSDKSGVHSGGHLNQSEEQEENIEYITETHIYGSGECVLSLDYVDGYGYTLIFSGDRDSWYKKCYSPDREKAQGNIVFYDGDFEAVLHKILERINI